LPIPSSFTLRTRAVLERPPYRFDVLTPEQPPPEAICMRIFSDGSPGAKEAGVIHFIDKALGTFAAPQKDFVLTGLADVNKKVGAKWPGTSFPPSPEQQDEYLKSIEQTPFFGRPGSPAASMFGNPSRREPGRGGLEAPG
jgi:hypothetical protein